MIKFSFLLIIVFTRVVTYPQPPVTGVVITDSITVAANASYDSVSGVHRFIFGENYRKLWVLPATLPVIQVSKILGGLTFIKTGGGHQTRSLQFKDKNGKEWVLRSVNKYPDILLPPQLRETFAKDWFRDNMSAQDPYSALVVPVVADALQIAHTNPIIGWVAADTALGAHLNEFANTVCLFEEREPVGKTSDSEKMMRELDKDNDNSLDSTLFLRARVLDLFLGDWDRHADQWRWKDAKNEEDKFFLAIPKDRDQVFHVSEGLIPTIVTLPWIVPFLHNYDGKISKVNAFFFESQFLNERFLNQFSHEKWMKTVEECVTALTDSVLERALTRLPKEAYRMTHDALLAKMKVRRSNLAAAMNKYYRFLNKTVDIQVTNKNELVEITDTANKGLNISIHKLSKENNVKRQLFFKTFYPAVTDEIRIFVADGNDSVVLNNKKSRIKLRITGGEGNKKYNVIEAKRKVDIYAKETNATFTGEVEKLKKHLSNDSANTAIALTNSYNVLAPMLNVGYNVDDGLLLGLSFKYTRQGFRKKPGSVQQLLVSHSFSTSAYRIKYNGEFLQTRGKADLMMQATALAPNNTLNFFGRGNETVFTKTGDYKRFYRARFRLYEFNPAIRWRGKTASFSIGPSIQYYRAEQDENTGRLISYSSLINAYDSNTIFRDKTFAGVILNFTSDKRNNSLLPSAGSYANIKLQGYNGLNKYSKSFVQFSPVGVIYKSLNASSSLVLANRIGGALTFGNTTFYQSAFLGSQENLLGYRQFRFAGQQMIYDNLEARIKLADVINYILPGQLGLAGFYDVGRVWEKNQSSAKWHTGIGGGVYFAPAQMALFQLVAGHSTEGWYPYFTMGFRF